MNEQQLTSQLQTPYARIIKPVLDWLFALVLLVILSPVMLMTAIIVKVDSKGPVFFVQEREGKNRQPFKMYKFRTMAQCAPHQTATQNLVGAEDYITRVGKYLRKFSVDELPQLVNIVKGEMSFVGPRPLILNETDVLLAREANGASLVKPGITGLAQVSGRDDISDVEKAKFDGEYASKISACLDIKIIFHTFFDVIQSKGVTEGKQ